MTHVLVVDDDADIVELITFKLEASGFEVHSANNGEAALAAAIELQPDLLLLDLMMPGMTGIEVCRHLKDRPGTRHIPVILITAKAQESDIQAGLAAGAADYIVKPFSPSDLAKRVETALAEAQPVAAASAGGRTNFPTEG